MTPEMSLGALTVIISTSPTLMFIAVALIFDALLVNVNSVVFSPEV